MNNDTELLRRYVEAGSECAFSDLVREHLNLIYSTALRETSGDRAQAEDLSQAVFTEFARKSRRLLGHPCVAGWLYTTVRHLAANWRRSDRHRRQREQEAQSMNELLAAVPHNEVWQRIGPVLDDALHDLKETDRAVVVLRFLEERTLAEVGVRLGLSEEAARARVDRALEKLRGLLARRGITSTASGLAAALAIGAITPAPAALASSIAGAALAGATVATTGSTALCLLKVMSITKTQVMVIGALVLAGVTVPVVQQTRLQRARAENAQLRAQATELKAQADEAATVRGETERVRTVQADKAELESLRQWKAQTQPELLRLRGMAGVARRANLEADQLRAQLARQTAGAGSNLLSAAMADRMRLALDQHTEGRLARLTASLHLTPEQTEGARIILKPEALAMIDGMELALSGKFSKDEVSRLSRDEGANPDERIKALLTPEQKAAYPAYQQEEAAYMARAAVNAELPGMEVALGLTPEQADRAFAALYQVILSQVTGNSKPAPADMAEKLGWMWDQKAKALESVLTPAQMQTYRQQIATQTKAAKDMLDKIGLGGAGQ